MKKILPLVLAMIVSAILNAQQTIPFQGVLKTHAIYDNVSQSSQVVDNTNITAPIGTGNMSTASVQSIYSLPNLFGYAVAKGQKQISSYPELNAVAFCNRSNTGIFGGTSSDLRYTISTDTGNSWVMNPLVLNPNTTTSGLARYPNSILFQQGTNGLADLKLHVVAPSLSPSLNTWDGQVHITVQNVADTSLAFVSQEEYNFLNTGIFQPFNITERVHNSGEFWMVCTSYVEDNDSFYVCKGSYDLMTQKINWVIHNRLLANWNMAVDNNAHYTSPKIVFSPDGTSGYVATLGDVVGGRDSAYFPIVWAFNGSDFVNGTEVEVDINVPDMNNYVLQWVDSANVPIAASTGGKVSAAFDFDLAVDINGNPHIMTLIAPAVIEGGGYYSIVSSFGMRQMDIILNTGTWSAIELAKQQAFREEIGVSPNNIVIDPNPMVSRSLDGRYIFFTWTDSDSAVTGSTDNTAPNLWGRMFDAITGMTTDSINWSLIYPQLYTVSRVAKTSELVFEYPSSSACGKKMEVPTTIIMPSNLSDALAPGDIYYVSDISYACESAVHPAKITTLASLKSSEIIYNLKVFPNPAHNQLQVQAQLTQAERGTLSLFNLNGQKVRTFPIEKTTEINETLSLSGLPQGMYFLHMQTESGFKTQKIAIE